MSRKPSSRSCGSQPLLTAPPEALKKALRQAAGEARRLAPAYGAKVPIARPSKDGKERFALSTPEIKRALEAAAVKANKIGVALGVAKPIRISKAGHLAASKSKHD